MGGNQTGTVHTGYCGIGENGVQRRLSKLEGSAPVFFKIGVMAAVMMDVGTVPVVREAWMMREWGAERRRVSECVGGGKSAEMLR